jgi:hypothetical protein
MDRRSLSVGWVTKGQISVRLTEPAPKNHNVFASVNAGKVWFLIGTVHPNGPFISTTGFAAICSEDRAAILKTARPLIGDREVVLCKPPPPGFWDASS